MKAIKAVLLALMCVALASAAAITHNGTPDNTTTTSIVGITGFATTGNQMVGMTVTGTFGSGGTATCIWAQTGANSGGCTGTEVGSPLNTFTLSLAGDTFTANWNLSATGRLLQALTINALDGATVFDIVSTDPTNSTPGSSSGFAISGTVSNQANTTGIGAYSNRIQVGANPAVGDLYGFLSIQFDGLVETATFRADTDTVGLPGGGGDVPEPSSIALLAAGVALIAWKRSRR